MKEEPISVYSAVMLRQENEMLKQENEELKTILNNIHNYIEKMSFGAVVDNPRKDLVRILEKEK